jgi:hypothetical protein
LNRHRALALCLSMISAQTLCVCREGKPLHTFPDHVLAAGPFPTGFSQRRRGNCLVSTRGRCQRVAAASLLF